MNDHEEVEGGAPEVKPRKDVTKCLKDEDQWPKGLNKKSFELYISTLKIVTNLMRKMFVSYLLICQPRNINITIHVSPTCHSVNST